MFEIVIFLFVIVAFNIWQVETNETLFISFDINDEWVVYRL